MRCAPDLVEGQVHRTGEEMIIEEISISAPEGHGQDMCSALASLTASTEVQPGCLSYQLFHNWQQPSDIFIRAKWATAEDLVLHLQSDTYKRILLLMELSPSPPSVQFYTVQEVQGLDLVQKVRV